MNAIAVTGSFFKHGIRIMSLEEKWSLALKVITFFGAIYITSTIAMLGWCMLQSSSLNSKMSAIEARLSTPQNPPQWFLDEFNNMRTDIENLRRHEK